MPILNKNQNQKGSIMVEVIAVLGLIALITPLLFQQIARRNEEIVNTQIASEMRAVKDAVAAYIQANESNLAKAPLADGCALTTCSETVNGSCIRYTYKNISKDSPVKCFDGYGITLTDPELSPFFTGDAASLDEEYDIYINAYTVPTKVDGADTEYRPVIYGVIFQNTPFSRATLKRAARVAALIGLDGGVVSSGKINGIQGAWEIGNLGLSAADEGKVIAVTTFDDATNSAILRDVKIDHFLGETMQTKTAVSDRMNVREFLSIGPNDLTSCIENYGNANVRVKLGQTEGDESVSPAIPPECAPFFEVNGETGVVYIHKGQIRTGQKIEASQSASGETRETNSDGTAKYDEYQLDPAYTSVMNDIKLASRGGARLSDILPNYVLKDIKYIASGDTTSAWRVDIPNCPTGYAPAVTVVPSMVQSNSVLSVDTQKIADSIRNAADNTIIKDVTSANKAVTIDGAIRLVIKNASSSYDEGEGMRSEDRQNPPTGVWSIQPQYWVRDNETTGHWVDASSLSGTTFSALIHTYCVYDETTFTIPQKDRPEE